MAFSFGNSANLGGGAAGAGGGVNSGPDLETIQTEALGFLSIAGDAKVRLTSPWSQLPSATSSLLSIAPRKGLVAAAGPDHITLATTESVRKCFETPKDGDSDIRSFEPQLKLPMPMRVSQLAFTADENYLILSAETGGGLAVYEVQSLLQGSSNSAFELSTNGETLRALAPNPSPAAAELCAIVTDGGNLYMANLKDRSLSNSLKNQVSCVSWSTKGKQLCAGLADGTIYQMTPAGEGKAEIPKPPSLGNCHVSSLTWLENNLFLVIHSAPNESPSSAYHLVTREPPSSFNFQKLTDPVEPFGSEKTPHHSILRLKDFQPNLQDLLIVSSTASTEVGLLSRSKAALANDKPAQAITGVFTTTELLDDTKRPTLPMTDSMDDSTTVGVALDLSSKERVYKPIPSDEELEESPGPLPGLWVLTHEGVLCSWWVVYTDSIKQGQTYSGLAAVEGTPAAAAITTPTQAASSTSAPSFSNPGGSAFGSSSAAAPAFGASSQMGQKSSPWGATTSPSASSNPTGATFGSSTFGKSPASPSSAFGKPGGSAFGQSSQLGLKTSPWAAGGGGAAPAFGQSGFSSFANAAKEKSPFGGAGANASPSAAPSSGGFAGFAKSGGFASVATDNTPSVFGSGNKPSSSSPFGSSANTTDASASIFPVKQGGASGGSLFGSSSTPFKLESSFKPDPSQAESTDKAPAASAPSMFGSAFGSALTDAGSKPAASTPSAKDEEMDTMGSSEDTPQAPTQPQSLFAPQQTPESTTPTTTPAPSRFTTTTSPAPGTSLFGQPTKLGSSFSGGLFGSKQETPKSSGFGGPFSQGVDAQKSAGEGTPGPQTPKVKQEPEEEAPLPPDTTSKMAYPLGDSSSSSATSNPPQHPHGATTTPSKTEEAPLPPDFTSTPKPPKPVEDAPLPPDFTESSTPTDAPLPPDFVSTSKVATPKDADDAPLPPDFTKSSPEQAAESAPLPPDPAQSKSSKTDDAPLPPDFVLPRAPSKEASHVPSVPDDEDDDSDLDEEEDDASEGSGVDVAKDLSPSTSGLMPTPGFTPQSSFGGVGGSSYAAGRPGDDRSKPLFGEISRNAPLFPRPTAASPRSPSPIRGAVPNRLIRTDASRSVSAPGMASQILGPQKSQTQLGQSIVSREKQASAEDQFIQQHKKLRARQEAEEAQALVDQEDDDVQKILGSNVEGTLELHEFIAHSNIVPPAKESVPSQVEAVYRDINSMIDTLGMNSRTVKSFTKGHMDNFQEGGRTKHDLDDPDDWVLCEVNELGEVLDNELHSDLQDGRVLDLDDKMEACQDIAKDMHRLRAKQEDLKRVIMARMDPDQADLTRTLPLSSEQMTQQNELRREYSNFTKLLNEAEEALTLLKTRIAATSTSSGRGSSNVPTVEAVMRTISKMTTMVEKRSGDVDMLESQMRKVRLGSASREGSPMMTPQARRSVMLSPDSTPSRKFRQSMATSVMSFGASVRATPPRKKLSGFSKEEKGSLMEKRGRRQAVLGKLKESVEKRGVNVWSMEDIE